MSEKEELRKKIIDTAKDIITEEGYEILSMRKIASKIGYSAGIIYHYFKDKKEIADIICSEYLEELEAKIGERTEESPEKEFFFILKKYISTIIGEPIKYGAIFDMKNISLLKEGNTKNPILKRIENILMEAVEKSIFRKLDVILAAQTILVSANGVAVQIINEKCGEEHSKKLIDHYLYILFKGMLK